MKMHIITPANTNRPIYNLTDCDKHEQDVLEAVRYLEEKHNLRDYKYYSVTAEHLYQLFCGVTEDDLGYQSICTKLSDIIAGVK